MLKTNPITGLTYFKAILISSFIAMFLSKFDYYILGISLPTITEHFNVTPNVISKVVVVYFLILTSTLLIWGKLGDKIGLKKLLLIGLVIFSVAAFFSGLSDNVNILTILRFFQGIAASILIVISQAMVSYYAPEKERTKAFSLLTMSIALGMTLGTIIGGYISEFLPWNWIFWVNIPICAFVIFILIFFKPEDPLKEIIVESKDAKFDFLGAVLIFLCQALFVFVLYMGHKFDWNYIIILALLFAFLFLFLFIVRENTCSYPLMKLSLFKNIPFLLTLLAGGIAFFLVGGNLFLLPFFLIVTRSVSPSSAGLVLMTYPFFFLIMTFFINNILKRFSCWSVSIAGLSLTFISLFLFVFLIPQSGVIYVFSYLAVLGIGFGLFFAPNTKSAMDFVSPKNAGLASGIFRTFNYLGLVIGVCVFESIYSYFTCYLDNPSEQMQISGVQYAYIFGAFITFLGVLCTIFAKNKDNLFIDNK
ncbi:MAG: MFS transporter [Vampirovibrionia bacterium]